MLVCRTPFRISFFGGGTDYPVWYNEHGGAVVNTTIDKYCYVTCRNLPPFFDFNYRIRYYFKEECTTIEEIKHNSVRECLRFLDYRHGIEMIHTADLPAQSGLGSSSTFTVCLLHALYTLKDYMPTKRELARNAIRIEQEMIGEAVGSQDQTAAAFGGLNRIDFGGPQEIRVSALVMSEERYSSLQDHLLLFFTGFSRNAHEVAREQIKKTLDKKIELTEMMELVDEAHKIIVNNIKPIEDFGRLLHEQWMIKRSLTKLISNDQIDAIYETGRKSGAIGGKLCGAGNGGFMIFFVKPEHQPQVKKALCDLLEVPFFFENLGSQIIYYSRDQKYQLDKCSA
ncbi:MAG: kinase [Pseudomonadota bacterium]